MKLTLLSTIELRKELAKREKQISANGKKG